MNKYINKIKNFIRKLFQNIKLWKKENPKDFWVLFLILALAAVLRFYKISEYMTFLGDEGRDAIIVRRIFTELHPPLIGPGTSIGSMYLGPLYYYMMAPALLLFNFSPVGPAVQIAALGVVTVFLVWYITRKFFGNTASVIAAFFYAISPTVIIFSRSSWNPNIMPFFSLLCMYSIWKVWKEKKYHWLLILGITFAFVMQSHYLGLLLVPTIFIYYVLSYIKAKKSLDNAKIFKYSIYGYGIFLLLMSPLLLFDLRHNFMNSKAMYQFFTVRQTTVSVKPWNAVPKIPDLFVQINQSLITAGNANVSKWFSVFVAFGVLFLIYKSYKENKKNIFESPYLFLSLWMLFSLIGFGVYKQNIYDHYFGFVFVLPFILFAALSAKLIENKGVLKLAAISSILYLTLININKNPLKFNPNRQLQRSQNVSQKILSESAGKPFNLAVLAERNYEDGYRYFLELSGAQVMHADRWDQKTIVDHLYVICEMEEKKCDPTHSPKAEVANFGMSKIDDKWIIDGVIIYKLSHTK